MPSPPPPTTARCATRPPCRHGRDARHVALRKNPADPPAAAQGGLLCLAAIAVGLGAEDNDRFLESIVPPVLESFRDPDGGVRYYGLEALYNVAKVSRESFLRYFSDTFDSLFRLCADAETRVQARPPCALTVCQRRLRSTQDTVLSELTEPTQEPGLYAVTHEPRCRTRR